MGSWVQYDYSFYDETKKEKKPYKDRQFFSFQFLRVLFVQFLHLQVPDTPVLVLQLVPSTVNAELVWPDEESEDEEEDEDDDDDDELLEDPELESFLSLGQPAEQWPHSPVPVTWLPPSSTRVLHQNLPWVQKRFESKKSLGCQPNLWVKICYTARSESATKSKREDTGLALTWTTWAARFQSR